MAWPGRSATRPVPVFFGTDVPIQSCPSFRKVFDLVQDGEAGLGLVAVEKLTVRQHP